MNHFFVENMKRLLFLLLTAALLTLCACGAKTETPVQLSAPPTISEPDNTPQDRTVRLCVTELLGDSPVIDRLRERFERETPYRLDISRNPDTVALSVAESGGADVLIVRKGTASSQFIQAGYTSSQQPLLRDTLCIVGPAADPAGVSSADTGQQAMIRIAKSGAGFVSRYDDSDLSVIENRFWIDAGVFIGDGRSWYVPARKAMQGTLELAAEKQKYTLSTLEGYRQSTVRDRLTVLLRDKSDLENTYLLLLVDGDAFEHVNTDGAGTLEAFLLSDETRTFLSNYGTESYCESVFEVLY
jgi:tungstate transport system substrate-binding protein